MADRIEIPSNTAQIQSNYEKYKDYFTDDTSDELGQDQFLQLMVEQMRNQDFNNPTDNSEYIAQMAQFSMVQQMQQMNYNTNASYATSLIGKTVTTGVTDESSNGMAYSMGVVNGVKMNGTSFEIIVDGKSYQLKDITEVLAEAPVINESAETDLSGVVESSKSGTEDENDDAIEDEEAPDYTQGIF